MKLAEFISFMTLFQFKLTPFKLHIVKLFDNSVKQNPLKLQAPVTFFFRDAILNGCVYTIDSYIVHYK